MSYDSKFERKVHETFPQLEHHPSDKISYVTYHNYEPDFKVIRNNKVFYCESKGRFRDRPEAAKYPAVKEALLESEEIIFILMKRNTPMPGAKRRKDGTKQTMEEFLSKNSIRYFYTDTFNTETL